MESFRHPKSGLPPGHHLSGTLITEMDTAPNITRQQIINLVKKPNHYIQLHNTTTKTTKQTPFPQKLIKQLEAKLK